MLQMQKQGANHIVRVRALKGFFASTQGQFVQINPGDVVDIDNYTASLVISTSKAEQVDMTSVKTNRQSNYLPERKRNPKPKTEELLSSLVASTESNTKAIEALVAAVAALTAQASQSTKK